MKILLTSLLFAVTAGAPLHAQTVESERIEMPGQVVVCIESAAGTLDLDATVPQWNLQSVDASLRIDGARPLFKWQRRGETVFTHVVLVEYSPASVDAIALRQRIRGMTGVRWAAPNVGLTGEVKELIPNDPQYPSQYHHPLMQNDDAWDITLGDASVIMGITDDGVDIDHDDLVTNVWINPGEIPGDGQDNDNNGYIDDVNGFDFVYDNNDPNPNSSGDDHGTHVAGIAGARTNNAVGVAGTAGGSTIMPLQFYAGGQPWTAVNIADSFAYGADNGARILSTSYNINGWVGDPVVTAAFDYIYDQGVMHFNSAGNGGELNPIRQAFHQSFLVANTNSSDVKSSSSNYGTGIDLAAPGSSILSTVLNDGYGTKSGTSMAAPNAAGVAALLWSANPTWTRAQVAAQMTFFADNIDAQNPGLEGLLGGGRVNSFNALTGTLPAPQVTLVDGLPAEGATLLGDLTGFKLRFDQILDPAAVNAAGAFTLTYAGSDGLFGTGDDAPVAILWDEYLIAGNEVSFSPAGPLSASGMYRFTAEASVLANPFGIALDGNGDTVPGDSWTRTFSACATIVLLEDNAESGVDWSVVNENLSTGAWTRNPEVPIGGGLRSDPEFDFDGSGKCFLTQNGPGDTDVDGGPTRLISRKFDVTVTADPYLSYARWFLTSGTDVMQVDISNNDGATWVPVATLNGGEGWEVETLRVTDHVTPTAQTRLRFSVADVSPASVVEAAIDRLRIQAVDCSGSDPVGTSYCVTSPNSVGSGGLIRAAGSDVVADNDFTLIAENLPPGQFGIFFFGTTQVQVPIANGFLCVSGTTFRLFPAVVVDAMGETSRAVDLTVPPAAGVIVGGANLNFQLWYRDTVGAGSNYTDALNVLWQ